MPGLDIDPHNSWQGKVLAAAMGRMSVVVPSILADALEVEDLVSLLRTIKPRCWDDDNITLRTPFLMSSAKINKRGQIVADAIMRDFALPSRDVVMFSSEEDFEYELRKLSDVTRLSDVDRIVFFAHARRWVVADQRLDPTMDPRDPDARRLVN